jgi:hypothetical protein
MAKISELFFLLSVLPLGGVTTLAGATLKAGAAKVDITPPPGLQMWGYAAPAWETAALEKISRAIDEAHRNAAEAQVGCGHGLTYIGHNRCRVNPDGSMTMFSRNPTKLPTAPFDPTVSVLRVVKTYEMLGRLSDVPEDLRK